MQSSVHMRICTRGPRSEPQYTPADCEERVPVLHRWTKDMCLMMRTGQRNHCGTSFLRSSCSSGFRLRGRTYERNLIGKAVATVRALQGESPWVRAIPMRKELTGAARNIKSRQRNSDKQSEIFCSVLSEATTSTTVKPTSRAKHVLPCCLL